MVVGEGLAPVSKSKSGSISWAFRNSPLACFQPKLCRLPTPRVKCLWASVDPEDGKSKVPICSSSAACVEIDRKRVRLNIKAEFNTLRIIRLQVCVNWTKGANSLSRLQSVKHYFLETEIGFCFLHSRLAIVRPYCQQICIFFSRSKCVSGLLVSACCPQ